MSPRGKQTFAEAGIEVKRPGGTILKLVGTINFKAITVIKKGQNYYSGHFSTIVSQKNVISRGQFSVKIGWEKIPNVPICSVGPLKMLLGR